MALIPTPPSGVPLFNPATGTIDILWQNYFNALSQISGGFAPLDARYWVSTPNSDLTNETNLGALASGYLKITTAAGIATPSSVTTIPGTDITGAALSKSDDTNVTLTLAGSPTTALLRAASLALGWTGLLASSRGGTANGFTKFTGPAAAEKTFTLPNASATILTDNAVVTVPQGGIGVGTLASNGVLYGNSASAVQALAVNATATNKLLTQVSSGAPAWNTLVAGDVPNLPASIITSGQLALARGGTNADLSATGGTSQVLKQSTAGAAITVGTLASTNISDIAEGQTFTPTLLFGGAGTGIAYSLQVGHYLKIGAHVFYDAQLGLTSKGSSTGQATIVLGTLPVCVNVSGLIQVANVVVDNMAAGVTANPMALISPNTNKADMLKIVAGVQNAFTNTDFANGSSLVVSGHYETN